MEMLKERCQITDRDNVKLLFDGWGRGYYKVGK